MFTILVGSLVNGIRTEHLCRSLIPKGDFYSYAVLGDDNLIATDIPLTIEKIEQWRWQHFAWTVLHPEKCVVTDDFHQVDYLGHLLRGGSLTRAYEKVVRSACLPERPPEPGHFHEALYSLWLDSGSRYERLPHRWQLGLRRSRRGTIRCYSYWHLGAFSFCYFFLGLLSRWATAVWASLGGLARRPCWVYCPVITRDFVTNE